MRFSAGVILSAFGLSSSCQRCALNSKATRSRSRGTIASARSASTASGGRRLRPSSRSTHWRSSKSRLARNSVVRPWPPQSRKNARSALSGAYSSQVMPSRAQNTDSNSVRSPSGACSVIAPSLNKSSAKSARRHWLGKSCGNVSRKGRAGRMPVMMGTTRTRLPGMSVSWHAFIILRGMRYASWYSSRLSATSVTPKSSTRRSFTS